MGHEVHPRIMIHLLFPDASPSASMDLRAWDCDAELPKVYF